ncbi:DUF2975 domain-containing protein [Alteromonas gilva]|uniref:DUF2975 domain-containing protein n=1 Tax=Alteromonas gilva TaxID=2987522 RepID=A0ABT5L4S6_9ALTE|nr:DUF2975 domain-containing protein [Alteromonas gilva]MDC8831506.1 DUF2975 domain-containing protein [Alteromonas gilva]
MTTIEHASGNSGAQLPPPKYTLGLKICFDLLYYFSVFSMIVGVGVFLVVGWNIPAEISERHTDVNYLFNAKMLPSGVTDPSVSEVMLVHGMVKLNNTTGYAAWFIAYIDVFINGIFTLLGLYNLRKLFANLSLHRAFEASSVMYIKRLGIIVLSYSLLTPVMTYLCGMAILADIGTFHEQLQLYPYFSFPLEGVLVGAALIVLASLVKDASMMKQEQELTI